MTLNKFLRPLALIAAAYCGGSEPEAEGESFIYGELCNDFHDVCLDAKGLKSQARSRSAECEAACFDTGICERCSYDADVPRPLGRDSPATCEPYKCNPIPGLCEGIYCSLQMGDCNDTEYCCSSPSPENLNQVRECMHGLGWQPLFDTPESNEHFVPWPKP